MGTHKRLHIHPRRLCMAKGRLSPMMILYIAIVIRGILLLAEIYAVIRIKNSL